MIINIPADGEVRESMSGESRPGWDEKLSACPGEPRVKALLTETEAKEAKIQKYTRMQEHSRL